MEVSANWRNTCSIFRIEDQLGGRRSGEQERTQTRPTGQTATPWTSTTAQQSRQRWKWKHEEAQYFLSCCDDYTDTASNRVHRTHPPAGRDHRQRILRSSKTYYGPHDGRAVAVNETISYDDTEVIGLALSMMVATSAAVCGVIIEHTTTSSATKAGSASILYGDKT